MSDLTREQIECTRELYRLGGHPDMAEINALADMALRSLTPHSEREAALEAFHDAWVECEVARATGSPELLKEKRAALISRHRSLSSEPAHTEPTGS